MKRVLDLYCNFLKAVVALCLAMMVVLVFGNVVLRYAFNSGISVSEELSRWLLVWLTFLGAIVALREHAHLGVDTLLLMLPSSARRLCFLASYVLMLVASVLMITGSWQQTLINWNVTAPATGLSVGLFYGIGLIFGISAVVILVYDVVRLVTGSATERDLMPSGGETH